MMTEKKGINKKIDPKYTIFVILQPVNVLLLLAQMQKKSLHIICFDNPFPPVYGGAVDMFYAIKALSELGIEIYLHCYVNTIPPDQSELQQFTKRIFFYERRNKAIRFLSMMPYSVATRYDKRMWSNIKKIDAPILFEGLQTTAALKKHHFAETNIFLRLMNLEDLYYKGLYRSESNIARKMVLGLESIKYKSYQTIFGLFNTVFTLSVFETESVNRQSGNASYVPVFHGNDRVSELSPKGKFALYHGDLRTSDNKRAALFLIEVFKKIPDYSLLIASNKEIASITTKIHGVSNISHNIIKNREHLDQLLADAHINVMLSFQQSGTKLKAVNALYKSRFCIINSNMIDDPNVRSLCMMAETKQDFVNAVNALKNQPYIDNAKRKSILETVLNDTENAGKLTRKIFGD